MMLARAPAAVAQKRSPVCPGSSVTLPILRPSLVCRFKEDDAVEQAKQKVQDGASDLQSKLQQAAQRTGEGMDPDALKVNPAIPAFTRRREVFSGRLAMFGFFAACFWEYLFPSHPNVLQQISNGTAGVISPTVALVGILGLIAYNAISAAGPGSPSYSEENKRDADKRAPNLPAAEKASDIGKLFGGSGWGFTKANEVLHGRIAMLGFMGVVFQQLSIGGLAGPGPIAQLAYVLNQPATDGFYGSVATFFIGFSVFAIALAYLTGNPGSMDGEKDVY